MGGGEQRDDFAERIGEVVRRVLKEELKPGGLLTSPASPSRFELGDLHSQGRPSAVAYGRRGAD